MELANNHLCRNEMRTDEAWGKPRDKSKLRDPWGNGQWSEAIYYHGLNCGLRIPPSAGSASGVLPNPVGYNRMYVWVDKDEFNYDAWWESFKLGRVIVTNGPLIRPFAENRLPGHVFKASQGETLELEIACNLATRDKLSYLEIVQNGRVAHSVRLDDFAKANGRLPRVVFERSGWFLIRAIAENDKTYRFASSAPWYVEFDDTPRISKSSAQFFLDWLNERTQKLAPKLTNAEQRKAVLKYHAEAKAFWEALVANANSD
jgi:hypothetical protein